MNKKILEKCESIVDSIMISSEIDVIISNKEELDIIESYIINEDNIFGFELENNDILEEIYKWIKKEKRDLKLKKLMCDEGVGVKIGNG